MNTTDHFMAYQGPSHILACFCQKPYYTSVSDEPEFQSQISVSQVWILSSFPVTEVENATIIVHCPYLWIWLHPPVQ